MKIKFANKVIRQQIGQFKIHPLLLDVQQCTPSIVVIKINRLKEEELPSVAYLNPFNHLEQEINKMKKIAEEKMKNKQ